MLPALSVAASRPEPIPVRVLTTAPVDGLMTTGSTLPETTTTFPSGSVASPQGKLKPVNAPTFARFEPYLTTRPVFGSAMKTEPSLPTVIPLQKQSPLPKLVMTADAFGTNATSNASSATVVRQIRRRIEPPFGPVEHGQRTPN